MKKTKRPQPKYKIGELVFCYANADNHRLIPGWVEKIEYDEIPMRSCTIYYFIRWSDRPTHNLSIAEEGTMHLLVELVQKFREQLEA